MALLLTSVRTARRTTSLLLSVAVTTVLAASLLSAPSGAEAESSAGVRLRACRRQPAIRRGARARRRAGVGAGCRLARLRSRRSGGQRRAAVRDVPGAAGLPQPGGGYGDHRAGPAARDGAGPHRVAVPQPRRPGRVGRRLRGVRRAAPILKALRKRFDLVGFDPRGTNRSTPGIACEPAARTVRRMDRAKGLPVVNRASVRRALKTGADTPRAAARPAATWWTSPAPSSRPRPRPAARRRRRPEAELPGLLLRHLPRHGVRRPLPDAGPGADARRAVDPRQ